MLLRLKESIDIYRDLNEDVFDDEDKVYSHLDTVKARLHPTIDIQYLGGNEEFFAKDVQSGLAYKAKYLGGCIIGDVWSRIDEDYRVVKILNLNPLYVALERLATQVKKDVTPVYQGDWDYDFSADYDSWDS